MVRVAPKAFDVFGEIQESKDGAEFFSGRDFVEGLVDEEHVML